MITSKEIESVLKKSIDILRSDSYFSGKYNDYILQILFFKYLSDIDEENDLKKNINFNNVNFTQVSWQLIQNIKQDIGEKLTDIFHFVEEANPQLKGLLINPESNQWERLSDNTLLQLIQNLSLINLGKIISQKPELLGEIYENLILNFALYDIKTNVNHFTPRFITKLMVDLIKPKANMAIFDPACGSGGMLIECIKYFKNEFREDTELIVYGQEENYELRSIAKINLFLHGVYNANILAGNLLHSPPLEKNGKLQKFDVVITNPPFGVKNWVYPEDKKRLCYPFKYGQPPRGSADYAFIQCILAILKNIGKAAIIVPHGILFRGGSEGEIRKNILEDDVIEAIIALPENLFYNTKIPTTIIIFNRNKPKNKILFIDASNEYKPSRGKQNVLTNEHFDKIVNTYLNFDENPGYSKIVTHEEIAEYGYILDINHFVKYNKELNILDIDSQVKKIKMLETQRSIMELQMDESLKTLGIEI